MDSTADGLSSDVSDCPWSWAWRSTAPEVFLDVLKRTPSMVMVSMMIFRLSRFRLSMAKSIRPASRALDMGLSGFAIFRCINVIPNGNRCTSALTSSTLAPTTRVPAFSMECLAILSTKKYQARKTTAVITTKTINPCQRSHFVMISLPNQTPIDKYHRILKP